MSEVTITRAEWEIMRVIWAHNGLKSRQIIDILQEDLEWKEGTIKTLISRLVKKGYLHTTQKGRAFIYHTDVSEESVVQTLADELFELFCDRNAGKLISYIVKTQPISRSDIKHIQEILTEKAKTAPEEVTCHCLPGQCRCEKS